MTSNGNISMIPARWVWGPFDEEFACHLHVCIGSFPVFQFSLGVQKHACYGWLETLNCVRKCESEWFVCPALDWHPIQGVLPAKHNNIVANKVW